MGTKRELLGERSKAEYKQEQRLVMESKIKDVETMMEENVPGCRYIRGFSGLKSQNNKDIIK